MLSVGGHDAAPRHASRLTSWLDANWMSARLCVVGAYLLIALPLAFWAAIEVDEHFYLAAGRAAAQGELPYVDFPFIQGPLVAYLYAPSQLIAAGILSARLTSVAIGAATIWLVASIGARLGNRAAGLVGAAVLVASPEWLRHSTLVHSTELAGVFVALAVLVVISPKLGAWRWPAGGALLALAAGARINVAVALGVLVLYAFLVGERRWRDAFLAGTAGAATLLLTYAPLWLMAPESAWYNLVGYHLTDAAPAGSGLAASLVNKVYTVSALLTHHYFIVGALAAGVALALLRRRLVTEARRAHALVFVAALVPVVAAGTLLKFSFILYYLHPVLPLAAALTGVAVVALVRSAGAPSGRRAVTAVLAPLFVMNFVAFAPALFDVPSPVQSHEVADDVATLLAARVPEDGAVFTFFPVFAVEAKRPLWDDLEMGFFSYIPDWTAEKAERIGYVSNARALQAFESADPAAVVLTERDFRHSVQLSNLPPDQAAQADAIFAALAANYELAYEERTSEGFVQAWLRRGL